ncbi:hypothetical protein [Streptomyces sp. NPDC058695]|uniref:hypothetical protein n=1 Tax=Streptomyces sp. NPDC058695 TaxID=3346604 RepID=UPI00364E947F
MDRQAGLGLAVGLGQEVPEVHGPMLCGQVDDHLSGCRVQRGERVDGAVPHVGEAAPLGVPGSVGNTGARR